jgi:hypothetical protein
MRRLHAGVGNALTPFGDRISAAIIHAATAKAQTLRRLIYDHAMFDGKGCLSPQVVMVIAEHWQEVEQLAVHFAGVLAEENQKWPAGNWSAAEKALIQQWRGAMQARRAAGEKIALFQPADAAWTVMAAEEFDLDERVAFRTVRLLWLQNFNEAMLVLKNYSTKIQALAVEIEEKEYAQLALDLDEQEEILGRLICAPGELQRPYFAWKPPPNPSASKLAMRKVFISTRGRAGAISILFLELALQISGTATPKCLPLFKHKCKSICMSWFTANTCKRRKSNMRNGSRSLCL